MPVNDFSKYCNLRFVEKVFVFPRYAVRYDFAGRAFFPSGDRIILPVRGIEQENISRIGLWQIGLPDTPMVPCNILASFCGWESGAEFKKKIPKAASHISDRAPALLFILPEGV